LAGHLPEFKQIRGFRQVGKKMPSKNPRDGKKSAFFWSENEKSGMEYLARDLQNHPTGPAVRINCYNLETIQQKNINLNWG